MKGDHKYFEAIAERALERRSKKTANTAEVLRRVRGVKIAAGVATPPTDLYKLANHLGALEIRYVPLSMNGRLVMEDNAIAVEINDELSNFDKQFTIAHELAHLVLEEKRLDIRSHMHGTPRGTSAFAHSQIEKLCDISAKEILLPTQWLKNQTDPFMPSLKLASELSQKSECDLFFVVKRIINLGLWHCRILRFKKRDEKAFVTEMFPHVDDAFISQIEPLNINNSLLEKCFNDKSYSEGIMEIKIGSEEYSYNTQSIKIGNDEVLSMIIYTS